MSVGLEKAPSKALLSVCLWFAYFVLLTVIALPKGVDTSLHGAGLGSTSIKALSSISELKAIFGVCDAGSYITGAEDILAHGWWRHYWYYNLWAPGFFWLQALGLAIFGAKLKIALYLCFINTFAWSCTFWLMNAVLREWVKPWVAAALPLSFLAFPFFNGYFLSGEGIFMTEPISASLYTSAALLLLLSLYRPYSWRLLSFGAGIAFAACVYLRAAMEVVLTVSTVTFLIASSAVLLKAWTARRTGRSVPNPRKSVFVVQLKFWLIGARIKWFLRKPVIRQQSAGSLWKSIFVSLIVFQCLVFPWRLHNLHYRGDMQWIKIDYYWKNLFMRHEDFPAASQWYVMGGAPAPCYCNLKLCDEIREGRKKHGEEAYSAKEYQLAALKLFLRHPIKWNLYKLERLPAYWFSEPSVTVPGKFDFSNLIILLAGLLGLALVSKTFINAAGKLLFWLMASFLIAQYLSGTFLHFEVRYFYGLKTFALLFAILQLALFWREKTRAQLASVGQAKKEKLVALAGAGEH